MGKGKADIDNSGCDMDAPSGNRIKPFKGHMLEVAYFVSINGLELLEAHFCQSCNSGLCEKITEFNGEMYGSKVC